MAVPPRSRKTTEDILETSPRVRNQLEHLVAAEVRRQLETERSIIKDALGAAVKIIALSGAVLIAILTVFGLTSYESIRKRADELIKSSMDALTTDARNKVDELVKHDSTAGVRQMLDDLVNRSILASQMARLKAEGNDEPHDLSKADWDRLRAYIQLETLDASTFSEALVVLASQSPERVKSDVDSLLSDMLAPDAASTFKWIKRQPEKRQAILDAVEHEDLGAAALSLIGSYEATQVLRLSAIDYLKKIDYTDAFEGLSTEIDKTQSETVKTRLYIACAGLKPEALLRGPSVARMIARGDPDDLKNLSAVFRTIWSDSNGAPVRTNVASSTISTQILELLVKNGAYFLTRMPPNSADKPEASPEQLEKTTHLDLLGTGSGLVARQGGVPTQRIVSMESVNNFRPYWMALDDAVKTKDLRALRSLLPRKKRSQGPYFLKMNLGPNAVATVVVAGSGNTQIGGVDDVFFDEPSEKGGITIHWSMNGKATSGVLEGLSGPGVAFAFATRPAP